MTYEQAQKIMWGFSVLATVAEWRAENARLSKFEVIHPDGSTEILLGETCFLKDGQEVDFETWNEVPT